MSDELSSVSDGVEPGDRPPIIERPTTAELRQRVSVESGRQAVYRVFEEDLTGKLRELADSEDPVDRRHAFNVALESVKVRGSQGSWIVPLSRPAVALLEATLKDETDPEIVTTAMRHASRLIDTFRSHWNAPKYGEFRVEVEGWHRERRLFEAFDAAVDDAMLGSDLVLAERVTSELGRCPHLTPNDRSVMIAEALSHSGQSGKVAVMVGLLSAQLAGEIDVDKLRHPIAKTMRALRDDESRSTVVRACATAQDELKVVVCRAYLDIDPAEQRVATKTFASAVLKVAEESLRMRRWDTTDPGTRGASRKPRAR